MELEDITGVMVQYYVTCKRELWFYCNQINMNYDNDDISIGKLIHEKSYSRENKEVRVDNLVFDYVKKDGCLSIFEVKKSSKLTIGAEYQLYFYLYTMSRFVSEVKGVLVYPKEKKKEELKLDDEKIKEMATSYGRKEEELRKNEALVEYLRNSVKTEKAIELIVKNAKIKK